MPAAPIRLPEYPDDLTPVQILHLRQAFPTYSGDYAEICEQRGRYVLSYLERRAIYHDMRWVHVHGPPDRYSSLRYQSYMAWAVGRPFRQVARLLESAEWVLILSEEKGCEVSRAYCPAVDRDPKAW